MATDERVVATTELLLILPATLFLTAVVARHVETLPHETARAAQQIVTWYSVRMWTLWVLLIGLPLAALVTGCVTLLSNSAAQAPERPVVIHPSAALSAPTRIIAAATVAAGLILTVVALHMLAN
jgi:hypothetical protein